MLLELSLHELLLKSYLFFYAFTVLIYELFLVFHHAPKPTDFLRKLLATVLCLLQGAIAAIKLLFER